MSALPLFTAAAYNLFNVTLRKLGIDFTFVSPSATEEELAAAIRPNTKAIFGETISNPSLEILDIEKFARWPTRPVCR